jgi:hypothetical protein
MVVIFLLGFVLDFIEITFVVVPIVGPILLMMGADPIWLGIMIAINLQTSFLTPPFGFALFYLRGVAPGQRGDGGDLPRRDTLYRDSAAGAGALWVWPALATWLAGPVCERLAAGPEAPRPTGKLRRVIRDPTLNNSRTDSQ